MIDTTLTRKAFGFAKDYHKNDIDECGKPVMERLLYVAERMDDEVATCAALLQDTDPIASSFNLFAEYPAIIADAVSILRYNEFFYFDYLEDPCDVYIRDVQRNETSQKVMLEDLRYRKDRQNYTKLTADTLRKIRMYEKAFDRLNDLHDRDKAARETTCY